MRLIVSQTHIKRVHFDSGTRCFYSNSIFVVSFYFVSWRFRATENEDQNEMVKKDATKQHTVHVKIIRRLIYFLTFVSYSVHPSHAMRSLFLAKIFHSLFFRWLYASIVVGIKCICMCIKMDMFKRKINTRVIRSNKEKNFVLWYTM